MNFARSTIIGSLLLALAMFADANIASVPLEELLPHNIFLNTPEGLRRARALRQNVVAQGTCNPNVCFALDGSGSISNLDYRHQQDFVQLVAAIVAEDTTSAFAAVQYGLRNIAISQLTSDANQFLLDVDRSVRAGARRTFVAAGLGFCVDQLSTRSEDANKIVVLGDGRSNFGGNPGPISAAFRGPPTNGSICAVGIGFIDTSSLLVIAGSPTRVLNVNSFVELLTILDAVVNEICHF